MAYPRGPQLYSAQYFSASPTYHKWVKLTASDIHALHEDPNFKGQNTYFHLNHPIRFVYLTALVVAISDPHPKFVILTLDDSSGACIDVKIQRKEAAQVEAGTSNTNIKNLDFLSGGLEGAAELRVDGKTVDVGMVIKAKCTFGNEFRGMRQLELKRVSVVKDTSEEVDAWTAMESFRRDVLARPWVLTEEERAGLDSQFLEERRREEDEERKQRRKLKEAKARTADRKERVRLHEERSEQRRKVAEEKFNAGALI